jgi:hypothetical protein
VIGHHIFLVIWLVICPRTGSHWLFGNGSLGKPPPDPSPAVAQTVGIATAAVAAGLASGKLIS